MGAPGSKRGNQNASAKNLTGSKGVRRSETFALPSRCWVISMQVPARRIFCRRLAKQFFLLGLICLMILVSLGSGAAAQDSVPSQQDSPPNAVPSPPSDSLPVMFPHPEMDRLWLSGQVNIISQWHPAFRSPYQGPKSLTPEAQDASSRVLTLFTGVRLTTTTALLCDVQETGGHGIGEALGLAGFTNLDVVRNPSLSKAPYIARLMIHQIIPLGHAKKSADETPFSIFHELPERRLEIRFGKFSLADFFDLNTYGTDSNFQFMNWTVDNAGAYDYAADTRGYTFAAMFEYHDGPWTLR